MQGVIPIHPHTFAATSDHSGHSFVATMDSSDAESEATQALFFIPLYLSHPSLFFRLCTKKLL